MEITKNSKSTYNAKEVVLTIVVGLAIIYWFTQNTYVLAASIFIGLLGVLSTAFAEFLAKWWMQLGLFMGKIVSPIVLGLVFFLFLTPIAFLMRIFKKKDALQIKNPKGSVYTERNYTYKADDLENIW